LEVERALLEQVLADGAPLVVALGSATLLERRLRLDALERAVVVSLGASAEELVRRAKGEGQHRLTAVPEPERALEVVVESRRVAYAEAQAQLMTEGRPPEALARDVRQVWQRDSIAVALGERTYAVEVGEGCAATRAAEVGRDAPVVLLVTDRNVAPLHAGPVAAALGAGDARVELVALEPGEQHKNPATVVELWRRALGVGADRTSLVVGLGGGVVTDVAGFAAATYMRGVRWVAFPTTLLGMVDASVGGKTAVDLGTAKNAVGAFWQPSSVVCDLEFLRTEPGRGYVGALAEVAKSALVGDRMLFDLLEGRAGAVLARDPGALGEVVRRSVAVKAGVVGRDEREGGLRAVLNLGHTVGHALEAAGGYRELSHGEAVSLGLVAALRIGRALGRTSADLVGRVIALLGSLGLPTVLDRARLEAATSLLAQDKKRAGGSLRFVVVEGVGQVSTVWVGLNELGRLVSGAT
jgi:shikimate kinase/3-dehydroquinate synthase